MCDVNVHVSLQNMFSQRVNFKKYGYTWHRVIGASRGREKATEPVSLARQDRVKREETEKSRKNKKVKTLCFLLIGRAFKLDWRTGLSNIYRINTNTIRIIDFVHEVKNVMQIKCT